jgi:hypothetical protein
VKDFLNDASPDRRGFIQRILAAGPFASPAVRSFVMAAVAGEAVIQEAEATPTTPGPPPRTTNPPSTTVPPGAPEIDASSAVTGLTLLAGSVAIARSRRAKTAVESADTAPDEKKS